MVDVRDIADAAFIELTRLEAGAHDGTVATYNLVGPDALTGQKAAEIWSQKMGAPVAYIGDDLTAAEERMAKHMPLAIAYDLCLMFARFHADGFAASAQDIAAMTKLLGRLPRSYSDFVDQASSASAAD